MKKFFTILSLMMFSIVAMTSCSNDDEPTANNSLENTAWELTYETDGMYNDYFPDFYIFNSNGKGELYTPENDYNVILFDYATNGNKLSIAFEDGIYGSGIYSITNNILTYKARITFDPDEIDDIVYMFDLVGSRADVLKRINSLKEEWGEEK